MEKKLTPKLRELKREFDFLHGKIGELEWELAAIFYGRRAVTRTEVETVEAQLDNYRENMEILIEKIKYAVREANDSQAVWQSEEPRSRRGLAGGGPGKQPHEKG